MSKLKQRMKILIVDDDQTLRDTLRYILTIEGFVVEEAKNGKEALDKISKNKPNLILLDAVMPVMDGFEVSRQLKSDPETKHIPIIFCSATYIEEAKQRKIKVEAYIEKPFSIVDLYKKIHSALKATGIANFDLE